MRFRSATRILAAMLMPSRKRCVEALSHKKSGRDWWRLGQRDLVAAAIIVVLGALTWFGLNVLSPHAPPEKTLALGEATPSLQANQPLAEAKGKAEETEGQRLAAVKEAEQERQARATDEEAKRKAEEVERERLAALKAGEERRHKAFELFSSGKAYLAKDDLDRAIADFDEAIRLNPQPFSTGPSLIIGKVTATEPLPITVKPSGSIQEMQPPLTIGASFTRQAAIWSERLPT